MAEAAIEFANVTYALPDRRVLLQEVSLRITARTTTALLGRSGSGKTTLLRMVNGLATPTSGEVLVGGRAVRGSDLVGLRRGIGYVIQETGLFPHMTVERNVGMALELAGVRDEGRVAEVLGLVGMQFEEFRGRYPWQLSGGQRQRVGLARALASDPGVLLMDEPFGALDPMTRAEMQEMVRELMGGLGKTVVLVTHDLEEAMFLAGRVVFLDAGEIVGDVASSELRASDNPHIRAYLKAIRRGDA